MESKNIPKQQEVLESDRSRGVSKLRRNLLKASPALLVLANKPAFAGSCSISGFMSARVGTSLNTYDPGLCNGWSPGNWKNGVGQITDAAWSTAGISRGTPFSSIFRTANLSGGWVIKKLLNGAFVEVVDFTSSQPYTMQQALEGAAPGANSQKDIVKHAAAAYLNASFLENGGGGSNPDPWMPGYPTSVSVIVLYLLYELTYLQGTLPAGCVYQAEGAGTTFTGSSLSTGEYANYFKSIADGSGSQGWQDGL